MLHPICWACVLHSSYHYGRSLSFRYHSKSNALNEIVHSMGVVVSALKTKGIGGSFLIFPLFTERTPGKHTHKRN